MKEASLIDGCRNRGKGQRTERKIQKAKRKGERTQQRNEIHGTGQRERGRGTERIPTGITSVHVFMSARSPSEAFGKNAYLLPIRIS